MSQYNYSGLRGGYQGPFGGGARSVFAAVPNQLPVSPYTANATAGGMNTILAEQYANAARQGAAGMSGMGGSPLLDAMRVPRAAPVMPGASGGFLARAGSKGLGVANRALSAGGGIAGPVSMALVAGQYAKHREASGQRPEDKKSVAGGGLLGKLTDYRVDWNTGKVVDKKDAKNVAPGIAKIMDETAWDQTPDRYKDMVIGGGDFSTGKTETKTVTALDRAHIKLNHAMDTWEIDPQTRAEIVKGFSKFKKSGVKDHELIDMIYATVESLPELATAGDEVTAQEAAYDEERNAYNQHYADLEAQRQGLLASSIEQLDARQREAQAYQDARAMAMQGWAQTAIADLGQSTPQGTAALEQSIGLIPESMRGTATGMLNQSMSNQDAIAKAYANQVATMSAGSPVLNPSSQPGYAPYADAISQMIMAQGQPLQWQPWRPGSPPDPYAQMKAEADMMMAQAQMLNAQNNMGKAGAAPNLDPEVLAALQQQGA